jgi:hypothetical protein
VSCDTGGRLLRVGAADAELDAFLDVGILEETAESEIGDNGT